MQKLQSFNSHVFGNIRAILIDDVPWFIGKDVAQALGYTNTKHAINTHVDDDDKQVIQRSQIATFEIPNRGMTIINESGLYSLTLSSKLSTAKDFKRWVTSDVLPQIRQTGQYAPAQASLEERALLIMQELSETIERQKKQITQMTPGYNYASQVLLSDSTYNISQIAADYGMTGRKMNELLHSYGVQHKSGNQWILNAKYNNLGYVTSRTELYGTNKTHSKMRTVWTERGRAWIYKSLKARNILPVNPMTFAGTDVQDKELF